MKCNKARKWIALYREGELEAGIRNRLRKHLAECVSCSQIYQDYKKNDRMTAQIRSHRPVSEDEEILTGRIMNAVADMKKQPGDKGFLYMIDRLVDLAMLPSVQRIAVTIIIIITAVFGYQQFYIHSNTAKLEKQLSIAGKAGLMKTASKDMQDCMRKSAKYFSKVKTGQIKIESKLKIDIRENPEIYMHYASFICSHNYRYFENALIENSIVNADF